MKRMDQILRLFPWRILSVVCIGQFLSLLITGTGVTSQLLASDHSVAIPTSQSLFNYVLLTFYLLYLHFKEGSLKDAFKNRWYIYLILALVDVEANFLVVKAYQYTSITSIMLIDCFAIPTVMGLSYFFLKTRFKWLHVFAVALCLVGLGCLVASDIITGRNGESENAVKGDLLCLAGAVLYGASNVAQEYLVKQRSASEFLGMLGLWGSIISGIQVAILEWEELALITWSGDIIGLLIGFALCLFGMYSIVPHFLRMAGATVLNLSLLTSDFYGLLFGIFLFAFKLTWLYVFAFILIITGLIIYERQPPTMVASTVQNEAINHGEGSTIQNYQQLPRGTDEEEEDEKRAKKGYKHQEEELDGEKEEEEEEDKTKKGQVMKSLGITVIPNESTPFSVQTN